MFSCRGSIVMIVFTMTEENVNFTTDVQTEHSRKYVHVLKGKFERNHREKSTKKKELFQMLLIRIFIKNDEGKH